MAFPRTSVDTIIELGESLRDHKHTHTHFHSKNPLESKEERGDFRKSVSIPEPVALSGSDRTFSLAVFSLSSTLRARSGVPSLTRGTLSRISSLSTG